MISIANRAKSMVFGVILISVPLLVWVERVAIFDWTRLHNYQPDSIVTGLAADTTMNDLGKHLFYVYHPSLETKNTFNGHCSQNERTIVLGCYVSTQGIYIYNVSDVRLNGVEQVTAAHEMLHAAYDRLSAGEKKKVNQLILQAYSSIKDKRIIDTIANYKKSGADTNNELHSILGTEVKDLPPELETYYQKYFYDRKKIVNFAEQYEDAFDTRKTRVEADDLRLADLKSQIDTIKAALTLDAKEIYSEKKQMDNLLATNQAEAYNALVPDYNKKVSQYNSQVIKARSLIDEYNSLVKDRNSLALEENELIKAIDSRPDTVNSQ